MQELHFQTVPIPAGRNWPLLQQLGWEWPVNVIVHVAYSHFIGQWVKWQVNTM